jgi:hypothetical protein
MKLSQPQNNIYYLKIDWQSHADEVLNKRKEQSSSHSFSHKNSFIFHHFSLLRKKNRGLNMSSLKSGPS